MAGLNSDIKTASKSSILKRRPGSYVIVGMIFLLIPIINLINPIFAHSTMTLLNRVVIFSIAALGFNILLGYSGQVSLGHGAFMGLGAYISAYLTMRLELPFLLALFLAGVIPMILGIGLGLVALRLERLYLAIATLGLGVTIQHVFLEWTEFTNGHAGLRRIPIPSILGFSFRQREYYLIMSTIILVCLAIFAYNFIHSKTGRALVAMRDSEHASQAMGISLFRYKLIAFSLSTFYVGIAGSLYAHLFRYIEPGTWGAELSLDLLAMVVIGGIASIGGSIVGAAFIQVLPRVMQNVPLLRGISNINFILTGIALILVIIYFPQGIIRQFVKLWNKLTYKKSVSK
ncbi:branched-chain amino acid ABC transporter permease [Serpentinicella sp. ANB-PHB4]|uniref:branched-chain amino acid ABC transporter permease n=1 Tax=Serpentinicella sp. ANB-PHB4 TaxID=3074076 RepID=UPI00285D8109|nr:branched-chain amino acid ABC transporter permease [Serpentinicella sp. ANB-PHB4]MDR5659558.1 branched-chain amino acid ABC transporter permease [Serpentinicella sp. ANB-PHB4]